MEKFNFYLDEKVSVWMRTEYKIEAESLEEAKKKAIQFHKEGKTDNLSWDVQFDTQEKLGLSDNDNQSTEELYYENGDLIWENDKFN